MKKRNDLIYPELCYEIVGILYDVHNEIGPGHKEKYYQNAVAVAFKKINLKFQEQVYCPLEYEHEKVGKYFLDFLIDDKIILEIKVGSVFRKQSMEQIISYLKVNNLKLGILANFAKEAVKFKRIVNIK